MIFQRFWRLSRLSWTRRPGPDPPNHYILWGLPSRSCPDPRHGLASPPSCTRVSRCSRSSPGRPGDPTRRIEGGWIRWRAVVWAVLPVMWLLGVPGFRPPLSWRRSGGRGGLVLHHVAEMIFSLLYGGWAFWWRRSIPFYICGGVLVPYYRRGA